MKSNNNVLPYTVIVLATYGDINAINFILKHFEHYINKLSQKLCLTNMVTHIFMLRKKLKEP